MKYNIHRSDDVSTSLQQRLRELLTQLLSLCCCRSSQRELPDVLEAIVRQCTFYEIAKKHDPFDDSDVAKLASALWSVLCSNGSGSKLDIAGTAPGISGSTSRIEFARQYAFDMFYETNACSESSSELQAARRETTIVSSIIMFRICHEYGEWFSVADVYEQLKRCSSGNDMTDKFGALCSIYMETLAAVEELAKKRVD